MKTDWLDLPKLYTYIGYFFSLLGGSFIINPLMGIMLFFGGERKKGLIIGLWFIAGFYIKQTVSTISEVPILPLLANALAFMLVYHLAARK